MGQVTIYLDDLLETKMRSAAKSMHLSQSKWIANLIETKVNKEWSKSVKNLAGAWSDFPTLDEIRSSEKKDFEREEF